LEQGLEGDGKWNRKTEINATPWSLENGGTVDGKRQGMVASFEVPGASSWEDPDGTQTTDPRTFPSSKPPPPSTVQITLLPPQNQLNLDQKFHKRS